MFSWHQLASRALPLPAARLPGPISQGSGFFLNGLGLEVSCEPWKNWLWTLDSLWIFRVFEKFWESLKSWTTNTLEIVRGPHLLRLRLRFRRFRLPRTGNSSPSKKQNTTAKHHYNHYWLQFWSQNCINMAHKVCYANNVHKLPQDALASGKKWHGMARPSEVEGQSSSMRSCHVELISRCAGSSIPGGICLAYWAYWAPNAPEMSLSWLSHGSQGYGYSRHSSDSYSMLQHATAMDSCSLTSSMYQLQTAIGYRQWKLQFLGAELGNGALGAGQ